MSQQMTLMSNLERVHGVLGCLAFALFFPVGGILIRTVRSRFTLYIHAAWQTTAWLMALATMAIGIWLAGDEYMGTSHVAVGLVAVCSVSLQPFTGWVHHVMFKRVGGRTAWSYAHVFWGIGTVTLGIVNGGLGLQLAHAETKYCIVYGVLAAVVWLCWMGVSAFAQLKRRRARQVAGSGGNGELGSREKQCVEMVVSADRSSRGRTAEA